MASLLAAACAAGAAAAPASSLAGVPVGPSASEELLQALQARLQEQEERLARLEGRLEEQGERLERAEALLSQRPPPSSEGPGGIATAGHLAREYQLWIKVLHLGQVLSRALDGRSRDWEPADSRQGLHCMAEDASAACPPRTACPPGAFPMRMAESPPYFLCLRLACNDLDSTLSVFGRWDDGEFLGQALEALLRQTPPGQRLVVLDVGANLGAASMHFGTLLRERGFANARLVAVEPEPESAALLRAGVAINYLGDMVEVVEAAASDSSSQVQLHKFSTAAGRSTLGLPGGSGDLRKVVGLQGAEQELPYSTREVRSVRLDEVLAGEERVDFLKVDVEGHERRALEGLGSLLRTVSVAVVEFRIWALEEEPGGPLDFLLMLARAKLVLFCFGPCKTELSAVLRPGEQASFLGSFLAVEDFEAFVELCGRLKEERRDFDLLGVALDRLQDILPQAAPEVQG